jgi:multidrug efflux pump subunit AcrA (membrane-fusion protein)
MLVSRLRLLAGLALAAMLAGCDAEHSGRPTEDRPLLEDSLEKGRFERELILTGELRAVRSVVLSAPQTSVMQMRIQFMAEEGQEVTAGTPLLQFDDSGLASRVVDLEASILDAQTRLIAAEASLASSLSDLAIEIAEKEYAVARAELDAAVDEGILSRKEYGERKLTLSKAREQLEETLQRRESTKARAQADIDVLIIEKGKLEKDRTSAIRDVDLLTIEAPSEGLVVYAGRDRSTAKWQEGDSCWPGQTLMRLPDLSAMQVVLRVSEVDAPLLEEGMPVTLQLDSFPGRPLSGQVALVPSMAVKRRDESRLSVFEVTCALSETWVGEMKPGMSVQGRIVVESDANASLLARSAVRHDGERYWALTRRGGSLQEVEIEPTGRNATHYRIAEDSIETVLARLPVETTT